MRRADTTVELGSGQSFAIAGLLQDNTQIADNGVPFLGDIPILGALFRSDAFQRNETELVIIVTPYLVQPAEQPAALRHADDGWRRPTTSSASCCCARRPRAMAAPRSRRARSCPADAGFIVQ